MNIDAPIDDVFALFSDIDQAPENVSGIVSIERLTDGEVAKGTRFRETRLFMGRRETEELLFIEFNVPHSYTVTAERAGMTFLTRLDFSSLQTEQTQVRLSLQTKSRTLAPKLGSPLSKMMLPILKKVFLKDLADLKQVLEKS